jgi:hypothetical protein
MPPTAAPNDRSAQLRSQLEIVLLALVALATACTSTEPPPPAPTPASTPSPTTKPSVSLGDAAAIGACASITRRVLRGLVGAAADRGIEDLAAVEADLTAYLDQRCIAEHWADTVVPAMLACTRGDKTCNREALAPVMEHRPRFDEIIERHRKPTRP